MSTAPELRALRIYGALLAQHHSWAHRLVLAAGIGAAGSQIASAASIAGSTSLVVEQNSDAIKAAHRQGAFDFVVNTLDEALRTLKNEVRQGRPLAIGLIADETDVLAEAAERGLLPDLFLTLPDTPQSLGKQLQLLHAPTLALSADATSPQLQTWLAKEGWREAETPLSEGAIAITDSRVIRWQQNAPLYIRSARAGVHWTWTR